MLMNSVELQVELWTYVVDEFCGVTGSRDFSRLANLFNTLQNPLSNDSTFLRKKYISSCALSRSRIE